MNLKKKIIPIILAGLTFLGMNSVMATEPTDTTEITRENLTEVRQNVRMLAMRSSPRGTIGINQIAIYHSDYTTNNNNKPYWVLRDSDGNYEDLYCINLHRGFGGPDGVATSGDTDDYPDQYDLYNLDSTELGYTGLTSEVVGKVKRILNKVAVSNDNSTLLSLLSSASSKITTESAPGLSNYIDFVRRDMSSNSRASTQVTYQDVKIIAQVAIWHCTNPGSVFDDTINGIRGVNGSGEHMQVSEFQDEYIDMSEGYGDILGPGACAYNGAIKQAKFNAIYDYLLDVAENDPEPTNNVPTLSLTKPAGFEVALSENGNDYIVGPFSLTGTNTENITELTATINKSYTLLNSNKTTVENNNFRNVIGSTFYLRINKNNITNEDLITINLNYKYNQKTLILLTDSEDSENTQPVTYVANETPDADVSTEVELSYITVQKVWSDANNQDGKRPSSITVALIKDGNTIDTQTLTVSNLTYTWTGLLTGSYTVAELNGTTVITNGANYDENYVATYSTQEKVVTITNTHTPETINKSVTKAWDDSNNQDGIRPESVTVELLQVINGVQSSTNQTKTLNAGNNWTATFENLPKYSNGVEIEYVVEETIPNGYTPDCEQGKKSYGVGAQALQTVTITNSYTPGTVSKTVTKEWVDEDNADGTRPDEITVQLYANGVAYEEEVTLTKASEFTYTWTGLPEKQNGVTVIYTVEETKINGVAVENNEAAGYTVSHDTNNSFKIVNTHVPEKTNKTVTKIWEDNNNQGNVRPTSIQVQLYRNNTAVGSPVTISAAGDGTWTYTWNNLVTTYQGNPVTYTVKELDADGNPVENNRRYNLNYMATYSEDTFTITNTYKVFDLALRKFIIEVNGEPLVKTVNGEEKYIREPEVNPSTIATTGTAEYKHIKEPVSVEVDDTVTYVIRVYNEGNMDGYVSEITDNLPEYLEFLPNDPVNQSYLWSYAESSERKISTSITSKYSATGETMYAARAEKQLLKAYVANGEDESLPSTPDYIDVKVKCKVKDNVPSDKVLTNIAEITGMQDKDGTEVYIDRDSGTQGVRRANVPEGTALEAYKGTSNYELSENVFHKGQEDDDDFEKVLVKVFDLSLKKFIVQVDEDKLEDEDGKYTRAPKVNASRLGKVDEATGKVIQNATYEMPKDPVQVKNGSIVTYVIRVFNEGSIAGYVNEITENIPDGLEYIPYTNGDGSVNDTYKWVMLDKDKNPTTNAKEAKFLKTEYLSQANDNSTETTQGEVVSNILPPHEENSNSLYYIDVKVQFKVTKDPVQFADNTIKNVAEISAASNKDIDSEPGNTDWDDDDIDYELIDVGYFNLALRKYVTKVDETVYNNRTPEIKFGENGEITYDHTKDPVDLETGARVEYTIQIFNEGTIAGFAEEIIDEIPDGLEFLPDDEVNQEYDWKMLDRYGDPTDEILLAEKVYTNCLSSSDSSNIIDAVVTSNGSKIVSSKTIKIAFKVTKLEDTDKLITNYAKITKASDKDMDPTDDFDKEYVKIQNFDLALKKWVTQTIVTYNGKTTTTETGFDEDSTELAKVDIVGKQATKTDVKFVYKIKVLNKGKIAGYALKVEDYIPEGLEFNQEDNPDWEEVEEGIAVTEALADTLLQPGESATVEITLSWKPSTSNMGLKTNYAEIMEDSGDDINSKPNNFDLKEDDIDAASVILSVKTGAVKTYISLITLVILIIGAGTYVIKKKVLD